ncbi:MAG: hypothetical protein QM695_13365 [Micropruina sp.]
MSFGGWQTFVALAMTFLTDGDALITNGPDALCCGTPTDAAPR